MYEYFSQGGNKTSYSVIIVNIYIIFLNYHDNFLSTFET